MAEWVQDEDQVKLLRQLGVTYGQGWYYGKPQASMKLSQGADISPGTTIGNI